MRICIDARILRQPMTGVHRYTLNLVRSLSDVDHENEYFLILETDLPENLVLGDNFTVVLSKKRIPIPFSWTQIQLPYLLMKRDIDIFHCLTNWEFPFYKPCKYVITIHDLYPLLFPESFISIKDLLFYQYYKVSMYFVSLRADAVITASQNSKVSITRWLAISNDRVTVIPHAPDRIFRVIPTDVARKRVTEKYNIRLPFILHLGGIQSHKNTSSVVQAFYRLHNDSRAFNCNLVIAGRLGRSETDIRKLVNELDLGDRVVFTGFVPDEFVVLLYNAAELFVYPSHYEGFGLPVLEAMACGTPVVASKSSAIPEVAGNAGLLLDSTNIDEIAEGMFILLSDDDLRQELCQRGLNRAKMFSREETAKQTLSVYERVYSQNRSVLRKKLRI